MSRGVEWETIVVDNASTDGSAEAVARGFPQVKLMRFEENLGFARGNNAGMKEAKGDMILLLNSDCFVFEDALYKSQASMTKFKYDVLGCQLLNTDGTFQQSWGFFPSLRRVAQMMVFADNLPIIRDTIDSIHVRSEIRYQKEQVVDWVTGAWVLLKREVWEKTGGLDENYHLYGEEMEWMYRIKQAGLVVGYSPTPRAVHLLGASSPDRAPAVIGEMKGWLYWFSKHNPAWQQKVLPYMIMLGCGLRILLKPSMSEYYRKAFSEIWSEASGRSKK